MFHSKTSRSGLAKIAAMIKSSVLLGLEKLQIRSFKRAAQDVRMAVHEKIFETRTRGAFGTPYTPTRYRARPGAMNGAGLWRRNAAHGKVRGY